MKAVEYFNWIITDSLTGRRRKTRWKMPRDEAIALDPGAEPDTWSREVRYLAETDEERSEVLRRMGHGSAGTR